MDRKKLDEIQESADQINRLVSLLPTINTVGSKRVAAIKQESEMIKQLAASLKDSND